MATAKKLRYAITEEEHIASWQAGVDAEYDEISQQEYEVVADAEYELDGDPDYDQGADPDYDDTVQADYEPGTDPDYEEPAQVELVAPNPAPERMVASTSDFAYELGRPVVPATQQEPHPIVWRGLLKERHPSTGLVQRVPVYRLADGFWDCYREEELQAA